MDGKVNTVSPSVMMIAKIKIAGEGNISLLHNHPMSTSFSATDLISLNNTKQLGKLIVVGNDGDKIM